MRGNNDTNPDKNPDPPSIKELTLCKEEVFLSDIERNILGWLKCQFGLWSKLNKITVLILLYKNDIINLLFAYTYIFKMGKQILYNVIKF